MSERAARPSTGRVCACGRPKSKQGRKCQRCRTLDKRGPAWARAHLVGKHDPVVRLQELERARQQATGELRDLIEQQHRDDHYGHRADSDFHLSLDDGLYETVAA